MANNRSTGDRWLGHLIDVQGFEGELALDLRTVKGKDKQAVEGVYDASIGVNHQSSRQQGRASGSVSKSRLKLVLSADSEPPVTISLDAEIRTLRDGGQGLCGTYQVAARGHSALQEGVVVASSGRPLSSVAIEPEVRMAPAVKLTGGRQ
jgi:hypothetical protein